MSKTMNKITAYVPNLSHREDRRKSIRRQFSDKPEFELNLFTAITHENGAVGQWQSFIKTVEKEYLKKSDYFLFCEDDHVFTTAYSKNFLWTCIAETINLDGDVLLGGVSWMEDPILCRPNIFWINSFNGFQFSIIFNKFYEKILNSKDIGYVTDIYLSGLSDKIFVMYPFISKQREFGYSDITEQNNQKGYVRNCFKNSEEKLRIISKVDKFYGEAFRNIR